MFEKHDDWRRGHLRLKVEESEIKVGTSDKSFRRSTKVSKIIQRVWCEGNLKGEKKESKRKNVPILKLIRAFKLPSHVHPSEALCSHAVLHLM